MTCFLGRTRRDGLASVDLLHRRANLTACLAEPLFLYLLSTGAERDICMETVKKGKNT